MKTAQDIINKMKQEVEKRDKEISTIEKEIDGYKTSAELSAYNATMKVYASVLEKLDKMLPVESSGKLLELMAD